jgi:hypothetical protein
VASFYEFLIKANRGVGDISQGKTLGEPWFFYRLACYSGLDTDFVGRAVLIVKEGDIWCEFRQDLVVTDLLVVFELITKLQPLNGIDKLNTIEGKSEDFFFRIRNDVGDDNVEARDFESLGPFVEGQPSLRFLAVTLIELIESNHSVLLNEIRKFIQEQAQ